MKVKLFIIVIFILVINVIPVQAVEPVDFVDYSERWSDDDQDCMSHEIELVNSRLGFNVLEGVTIYLLSPNSPYISCWSSFVCFGNVDYANNPKVQGLIIHEIGHKVINDLEYDWKDLEFSLGYYSEEEGKEGEYIHVSGTHPYFKKYIRTDLGYVEPNQPYCQHCTYMNPDGQSYREDFADMFMGYFMGYFSDDESGRLREGYMKEFIEELREDGFGRDSFGENGLEENGLGGLEGLDNLFLLNQIQ